MRPMRLLPAAAAILLAACGSTPVPEVRYYSLPPATAIEAAAEPVLAAALAEGRQVAPAQDDEGVATDAIPVRRSGRVIAVIEMQGVARRYEVGDSVVTALEDVDLNVEAGE